MNLPRLGLKSRAALSVMLTALAACNSSSEGDGSGKPSAGSCSYNGTVMADGSSITAYQASLVPFGSPCVSENRTCANGNLSGSYRFGDCSIARATSCVFNGSEVEHESSVTAYESGSVEFGSTCKSQILTCMNGALEPPSGEATAYTYAGCTVQAPKSCLFNDITVAHGASIRAASQSDGTSCQWEDRICNNGVLSGSFRNSGCIVVDGAAGSSCWLEELRVGDGSSVTAYEARSVPFGFSCMSQTLTCRNGAFLKPEGDATTYTYASCTVGPAASCTFHDLTVAHGASVTAYLNTGSACQKQSRVCSNGILFGNYPDKDCTLIEALPGLTGDTTQDSAL